MIRAVAVAAVVLVAALITPAALGNPALNSADLILIVSPLAVLAIVASRQRRPRPVSERYGTGGGARPHSSAPPPPD